MIRRLTRERYLSDAELSRFMSAVRERRHKHRARNHALFALLSNTGIRPSEALALTAADLELEGPEPTVILHREAKPRTPEPVNELVIHESVAGVVRSYLAEQSVSGAARVFPITRRQAERLFHYYSNKAGLSSGFKLFSLRHTAGVRLWRATRDVRLVQAILGHRYLEGAMAYVHKIPGELRRALDLAGTAA